MFDPSFTQPLVSTLSCLETLPSTACLDGAHDVSMDLSLPTCLHLEATLDLRGDEGMAHGAEACPIKYWDITMVFHVPYNIGQE